MLPPPPARGGIVECSPWLGRRHAHHAEERGERPGEAGVGGALARVRVEFPQQPGRRAVGQAEAPGDRRVERGRDRPAPVAGAQVDQAQRQHVARLGAAHLDRAGQAVAAGVGEQLGLLLARDGLPGQVAGGVERADDHGVAGVDGEHRRVLAGEHVPGGLGSGSSRWRSCAPSVQRESAGQPGVSCGSRAAWPCAPWSTPACAGDGRWSAGGGRPPRAGRADAASTGTSCSHRAVASGQRVRKRQPLGGLTAEGSSPPRPPAGLARSRAGSGSGMAWISPAVYGCRGAPVDVLAGAQLHQPAQVHHADPVGQVLQQRQVVRDDHVGELVAVLERAHQVEYLRLDRDVKRGDRLVGDDDLAAAARAPGPSRCAAAARRRTRAGSGGPRRRAGRPRRAARPPWPAVRARCRSAGPPAARRSARTTGIRGSSAAAESWNIICRSRRRRRKSPAPLAARSRPSKATEPLVGCSRPTSIRPSVVLPQPDSPTMPNVSPAPHAQRDAGDGVHGPAGPERRAWTAGRTACTTSSSSSSGESVAWSGRDRGGPVAGAARAGPAAALRLARVQAGVRVPRRRPVDAAPGPVARQSSAAKRQRGANRHCGGRPMQLRAVRREWCAGWRLGPAPASAWTRTAPRCSGAAGRANSAPVAACSTTRPPYMTATRSACPAITPMSWVISSDAHRQLGPAARRSARGSAPGSRRRARWSARRR